MYWLYVYMCVVYDQLLYTLVLIEGPGPVPMDEGEFVSVIPYPYLDACCSYVSRLTINWSVQYNDLVAYLPLSSLISRGDLSLPMR